MSRVMGLSVHELRHRPGSVLWSPARRTRSPRSGWSKVTVPRVWSRRGWTSRDRVRQSGMMPPPHYTELDVVELLAESGRWPAGTVGTVIEASDAAALIEIADDRGHRIDVV